MQAVPASITLIWATRAHNQHHMAGSKPTTHFLQTQDGSRCMCEVVKRKQSKLVRGAHASIAGHHHTSGEQWHITYTSWRAASRSLTRCRIMRDPDKCVGLGERKQFRVVRGTHASMASHQHTIEQQMTCDTSRAASQTLTSCRIRRDPHACVG